jgi:CheY-like chemotaxis protein
MSEQMTIEIIHDAPAALWVLFALLVYLTLRPVIKTQLGKLRSVDGLGVRLDFAEALLEAQTKADHSAAEPEDAPAPSARERRSAVSRLEHAAEFMTGRTILWVDDHPEWNTPVATLFRRVGMTVETVKSTRDALDALRGTSFDLIITDMRRETEEPGTTAGVTLLDALAKQRIATPVILFSGHTDVRRGLPPGLFAYTSGGDNLVQYVIDVMERVGFGVPMRTPFRRR